MQKPISKLRRHRGTSIAEIPGALYLLIFGFAVPAIGMATISSRIALMYVLARNACNTACKASSYTVGKNSANTAMSRGYQIFPFLSGTGSLAVVAYPTSGTGGEIVYNNPPLTAAQINTTQYTYYVRWYLQGTVQPLIPDVAMGGINVPGLTGPLNLKVVAENYVENVTGLKN